MVPLVVMPQAWLYPADTEEKVPEDGDERLPQHCTWPAVVRPQAPWYHPALTWEKTVEGAEESCPQHEAVPLVSRAQLL